MRTIVRFPPTTVRTASPAALALLLSASPGVAQAHATVEIMDVTHLLEIIDEDQEVTEVFGFVLGPVSDESETVRITPGGDSDEDDDEPTVRHAPRFGLDQLDESSVWSRPNGVKAESPSVSGAGPGGGPRAGGLRGWIVALLRSLFGFAS